MTDHPELGGSDGEVVLAVHVQPGAGRTEVVGRHGDALKLRVAAPPTGGRANTAVVDLVAKEFNLKAADVDVVSGASSRDKRLKLKGIDRRPPNGSSTACSIHRSCRPGAEAAGPVGAVPPAGLVHAE
jgi:uncharacterized protein (TIGR00251 family)